MNLDKLIAREAPNHQKDGHDFYYARALTVAFYRYHLLELSDLEYSQMLASEYFKTKGNTHEAIANLTVLYELIKEKKNAGKTAKV